MTHLVQTGDVLDRGPDSKKVAATLLMALVKQANPVGGRVHAVIGNDEAHEQCRFLGAYVSKEECASYTDSRSVNLKWRQEF